MPNNPFTDSVKVLNRSEIAKTHPEIMGGASWFWWIAALSLVNSIMIHSGSDTNFVIGLGFTLLADAMFKEYLIVALVIDVLALGIFVGFGFLSRKGHLWAFITGIVLYSLDAIIYLLFQDWMSVAFHGLALFYMIRGAKTLRVALKAAAEPPVIAPSAVAGV
jgi:hypothetical protein